MLATLAAQLPTGPGWVYEVKWDGYRTIAVKDGARVALYSRNHKDFTKTYAPIAAAVRGLPARSAVLDGEVVAIDGDGRPSFQALHHSDVHTLVYYVFDLLHVDGRDLTREPLAERRAALEELALPPLVLRSDPLPGTPAQIEDAVRALGLEGLVAKRIDSRYEAGRRSNAWIKVKFQLRQELVVGGFTESAARAPARRDRAERGAGARASDRAGVRGGAPQMVDALVVGYYEGKELLSAGKVRAGLTPPLRRKLFDALTPLRQKQCPFANLPDAGGGHWGEGITAEDMETIVWLKPATVVQIAFTEWTRDGHLRHASFVGVRDDVEPRDVRRELPTTG